MKSVNFALCVILVQMMNNLCTGNQWILNDIPEKRVFALPSSELPTDQNSIFEINLTDGNTIKNPDKLKNYLKELQRIVQIMGKPR